MYSFTYIADTWERSFSSFQSWILLFHIYSTNSCAAFIPLVSQNRCSICTKSRVLNVGKQEESLLFQVGSLFSCNLFFFFSSPQSWMSSGQTAHVPSVVVVLVRVSSRTFICPHPPRILANFSSPETSCQSWSADEIDGRNPPACHILSHHPPDKLPLFVLVLSSVLFWGGVAGEIVYGILWHIVRRREDATSVDRK